MKIFHYTTLGLGRIMPYAYSLLINHNKEIIINCNPFTETFTIEEKKFTTYDELLKYILLTLITSL